jgi:TrpR family trp operon transcriptional repressor
MQYKHEYGVELEELIRKVSKEKDKLFVREFLFDLLSPAEYRDLAIRWQIVKLLSKGMSHREIAQTLKVSVATVTRGARELTNKKGGFKTALEKYYSKKP